MHTWGRHSSFLPRSINAPKHMEKQTAAEGDFGKSEVQALLSNHIHPFHSYVNGEVLGDWCKSTATGREEALFLCLMAALLIVYPGGSVGLCWGPGPAWLTLLPSCSLATSICTTTVFFISTNELKQQSHRKEKPRCSEAQLPKCVVRCQITPELNLLLSASSSSPHSTPTACQGDSFSPPVNECPLPLVALGCPYAKPSVKNAGNTRRISVPMVID